MVNLATSIVHQDRYDEAEKLEREAREFAAGYSRQTTRAQLSLCTTWRSCKCGDANEEALKFLREAVDHGLPGRTILGIEKDQDFNPLHGNQDFAALVKYGKEKVAAQTAK